MIKRQLKYDDLLYYYKDINLPIALAIYNFTRYDVRIARIFFEKYRLFINLTTKITGNEEMWDLPLKTAFETTLRSEMR